MNKKEFSSIFDNISDLQFENILKECGFSYKKVVPGNGGLILNGVKVEESTFSPEIIIKNIYDRIKNTSNITYENGNSFVKIINDEEESFDLNGIWGEAA